MSLSKYLEGCTITKMVEEQSLNDTLRIKQRILKLVYQATNHYTSVFANSKCHKLSASQTGV